MSTACKIFFKDGGVVLISPEDADLCDFNWCRKSAGRSNQSPCYGVCRRSSKTRHLLPGNSTHILLHKVVAHRMGLKGISDHKDGNSLNCQRWNLREATHKQNAWNRAKTPNASSSTYIGVCYCKASGTWMGYIRINRRQKSKFFPYTPEGEIAAAKWHDEMALKYRGEFARLNFPKQTQRKAA